MAIFFPRGCCCTTEASTRDPRLIVQVNVGCGIAACAGSAGGGPLSAAETRSAWMRMPSPRRTVAVQVREEGPVVTASDRRDPTSRPYMFSYHCTSAVPTSARSSTAKVIVTVLSGPLVAVGGGAVIGAGEAVVPAVGTGRPVREDCETIAGVLGVDGNGRGVARADAVRGLGTPGEAIASPGSAAGSCPDDVVQAARTHTPARTHPVTTRPDAIRILGSVRDSCEPTMTRS